MNFLKKLTNLSKLVTKYVLGFYKKNFLQVYTFKSRIITTCPILLIELLYSKNTTVHSLHLHLASYHLSCPFLWKHSCLQPPLHCPPDHFISAQQNVRKGASGPLNLTQSSQTNGNTTFVSTPESAAQKSLTSNH